VAHDPPVVLVVEDTADIRALIAINLQLEGFDVRTAVDGAECLAIVDEVASRRTSSPSTSP
jgi:DNA-binding response OmpR family regulator